MFLIYLRIYSYSMCLNTWGKTGKSYFDVFAQNVSFSFKVRNMKWLGFRVPLSIVNKAHQANQLYPFAMSLFESVRTYHQTLEKIDERPSINLLVAGLHREVQSLIAEVRNV